MKPLPSPAVDEVRRWALLALAVLAAGLLSFPAWGGQAEMRLIVEFCYYLALAQAWNLLAGYSGLVSVGQQAYVGLGSYTFIAATAFAGVSPFAAFPLAAILCAAIALPSASLMFRLQGAYFAIGTWALAEVFRVLFTQIKVFGAGTGLSLPISVVREIAPDRGVRETIIYYSGLALGLGATALVFGLMRSRHGLALTAIRDSESAAASVGVNAWRLKLGIYVLAAAIAGLVGALVILLKLRITPAAGFSVLDWSANVIFIVVIGGLGTIEGPIVGALVFFTLRFFLADYGTWYLIVLGAVAVVVMLRAPKGVWGYLAERYDLHLFPVQRRVQVAEAQAGAEPAAGAAIALKAQAADMAAALARAGGRAWRTARSALGNPAALPVRENARFAAERLLSAAAGAQRSIVAAWKGLRHRSAVLWRPTVQSARALWAKRTSAADTAVEAASRAWRILRFQASGLFREAVRRTRYTISWRRPPSQ
jgi:branched-chain amino acid transport system permease protein